MIGGTSTGSVTEDGTLTANGTLTITDVDTNDNPISFNDQASSLGTNGFGNFEPHRRCVDLPRSTTPTLRCRPLMSPRR